MRRGAFVLGTLGLALAAEFWLAHVAQRSLDWAEVFPFAVAATLIGLFDVWLPRGDIANMDGALVCSCTVLLGPTAGAVVVLTSRAFAYLAHRRRVSAAEVTEDLGRRLLAVAACAAVVGTVADSSLDLAVPTSANYLRLLMATSVFFLTDSVVLHLGTAVRLRSPFIALFAGGMRLLGGMTLAQVSVAVLAILIHGAMGVWGLLIVSALLLVMRQSFALLMDIRDAYRSTVEVLARALEAHDPERRGHAERVAQYAGEAGRLLGLQGPQLEDLLHAALFHDVGWLHHCSVNERPLGSAFVLRDVTLMRGALPILGVLDDAGQVRESMPEPILTAAYIVARASEYDDDANGRRHAEVAAQVGARLYSSSRRVVDRVLRRVEARAVSGGAPRLGLETGGSR